MTKYALACFQPTDMGQSAQYYRGYEVIEGPTLEAARATWSDRHPELAAGMAESSWGGSLVLLACDDHLISPEKYHCDDLVAVVDWQLVRTSRACHFPTVIERARVEP